MIQVINIESIEEAVTIIEIIETQEEIIIKTITEDIMTAGEIEVRIEMMIQEEIIIEIKTLKEMTITTETGTFQKRKLKMKAKT